VPRSGNWGHYLGAFLDWVPNIDGDVIPMNPYLAWANNAVVNNVPILLGNNKDEGAWGVGRGLWPGVGGQATGVDCDVRRSCFVSR
jgi:hypothetical protein